MGYFGISIVLFLLINLSQQSNYRLPNNSAPIHYKIKMIPHIIPGNFTFDGESEIFLMVLKETKNLTLHALNLKIYTKSTHLFGDDGKIVPHQHIFEKQSQFLILNFRQDLAPGHYILKLKFSGSLNNNLLGFFRNFYENKAKKKVYLAATQFETTFAREAFPCWDEPALKATFDISIKHFPNYTALSNMPVKNIIKDRSVDKKIWTNFETTPLMSTYIVCFTVFDFESISNSQGNFSVWAKKSSLENMAHAFNVGLRAFPVLEKYTGIAYHFPKMDIVAIPQFRQGAMENWGLILAKERIMDKSNESTVSDTLFTSMVIVHEIAHQWFGNLVTPAWWSDIWITEGLATYFHYLLTGKVLNIPRIMEFFVVDNNYQVFDFDFFTQSRPLVEELKTPREIYQRLMTVHSKAATMMHMLSGLISQEVFHSGIKKLLEKYKFKAVTTDDFLETMQEAANESNQPYNNFNIKMVMNSFISQAAYPVINVERDYTTGVIKLTQECIVCQRNGYKTESKFWVPINMVTSSSLNFSSTFATHWMQPEKKELVIEGIDPNDWYIINVQSSAFYRVNYDKKNWNKLGDYLNSNNYSKIHVLNRAQILLDAHFFYRAGKVDNGLLKYLTSYLIREVDYVPWNVANDIFFGLKTVFSTSREYKKFVLPLVDALMAKTRFEEKPEDDLFTIRKRLIGLRWICKLRNSHCKDLK